LSISWEALQIAEHWRIAWGLEGEMTIAMANMADVGYAKFDRRLHTAWPATMADAPFDGGMGMAEGGVARQWLGGGAAAVIYNL